MSADTLRLNFTSGPGRLTDEDWRRVEHLFPTSESKRGRPRVDARHILDAVLWVCFDGNKWNRLPSSFPAQQTCYLYFLKWRRTGVLTEVARELGMPDEAFCGVSPES
ncbi:transposase [Paraburkholderia sp. GAS199]|uniref:transposase n=1 Tax=Paraburkholderia sp. GAS199 TaxID=3035126 RepID=UPI003D198DE0